MGPGVRPDDDNGKMPDMPHLHGPLRVGVGGPVGSGKTALMDLLCKSMRERYDIAAITNDIYTKWDAEFLVRSRSLTPDRIAGVETGGCPHRDPRGRLDGIPQPSQTCARNSRTSISC